MLDLAPSTNVHGSAPAGWSPLSSVGEVTAFTALEGTTGLTYRSPAALYDPHPVGRATVSAEEGNGRRSEGGAVTLLSLGSQLHPHDSFQQRHRAGRGVSPRD